MAEPLTQIMLDGLVREVIEAVREADAQDCSSPDCIADAVYEIVRVRAAKAERVRPDALREAAQAVVDAWDAPHILSDYAVAAVASVMPALRAALASPDPAPPALDADAVHRMLMADPLLPDCEGTHAMGYGYCQRIAAAISEAYAKEEK